MFAKIRTAIPLAAVFFLLSALAVSAESEKKPGFHGWGDSQMVAPQKKAAETRLSPRASSDSSAMRSGEITATDAR